MNRMKKSRARVWPARSCVEPFSPPLPWVGALTLLVVGLNPVVFVTLLLLVTALAPVLLLGFAIVITNDLKRHGMANTSEQPCSCHQDRLESTFSKR